MANVLIVDDEGNVSKVLASMLQTVGHHKVFTASDGVQGLQIVRTQNIDLMITDIRMAPMNGIQLLQQARKVRTDMVTIIVTAYASTDTAVEAYDLGAYDYVTKPFRVNELLETVNMALKYRDSKMTSAEDYDKIQVEYGLEGVVAVSLAMQNVCDLVKQFASWNMPALITGPVGTGRRTIASAMHKLSSRCEKECVTLDCRATPNPVLDVELFRQGGALEKCAGGTLVLSDVDCLSPSIQARVLGVMNDKAFAPAKSEVSVQTDFRLIGTTTMRADEAARKGLFLADTAKVPSRVTVEMAALGLRSDDVLPLALHLAGKMSPGGDAPKFGHELCRMLSLYSWPGNVTELAAVVGRLIPNVKNGAIGADAIPSDVRAMFKAAGGAAEHTGENMPRGKSLLNMMRRKRREQLLKVVKEAGGDRRKVAMILNMSLADLNRELDEPKE